MVFSFLINDCCIQGTALDAIPNQQCPENIWQIQRFFFSKKGEVKFDISDPTQNLPSSIAATGNTPDSEAPWLVLFTASDASRTVKTPFETGGGEATITPGDTVTKGGADNTFFSGTSKTTVFGPSDVSIRFDSLNGDTIKSMRSLMCNNELDVWFINQQNYIIGSKDDNDIFTGFTASNFALTSLENKGFGELDSNVLTFQLPFDWDETKHFVKALNWSPIKAA